MKRDRCGRHALDPSACTLNAFKLQAFSVPGFSISTKALHDRFTDPEVSPEAADCADIDVMMFSHFSI
ncbi:MAG TPA: hypothetical protein VFB30_06195, partial [Spirochaetia bacterium]|nr:hypothetical protein [Spirochaetia bacterium]